MRIRPRILCVVLIASTMLVAASARAQTADAELAARLKAVEERVRQLEAELAALRTSPAPTAITAAAAPATAPAAPVGAPGAPAAQLPVYGGANAAAAKVFNPDISLVGNFVGALGRNSVNPARPGGPEAELGLQAIIDPFARGDVFLPSAKKGGAEEGYITFTSLPGGLLAKVGKMRSDFGVVNKLTPQPAVD
jgi:hypothetical protein